MGVYTYTLRTKTQNIQLVDGCTYKVNLMSYLCRSNDHDMMSMWPEDFGYKRAMGLNATIDRTRERFYGQSVYFMTDYAEQGHWVYRAEDAEKAAVWYDCDCPTETEGVTKVGRLGPRVRMGRKLVWTIMTDDECEAFDKAEREAWDRKQAETERRCAERRAQEARERAEREAEEARKAQAQARYDAKVTAARAAADEMVKRAMEEASKELEGWNHGSR